MASLSNLTNFIHSEVDDLESVLYTVLSVCTYTNGPAILRCPNPQDQPILMNTWFYESSRGELARRKDSTLSYFGHYIEPCLPKYWKDFAPYLKQIVEACWDSPTGLLVQTNVATHDKFIKILDDAIYYYETNGEQAIPYACILTPPRSPLEKRRHHEDELEEQRDHKLARTGD